jgi:hypothetical protein
MDKEREDQRQDEVVHNMHSADNVLKNKFLGIYVPYQERLFKIDHGYRDLVKEYLAARRMDRYRPGRKPARCSVEGLGSSTNLTRI